MPTRFIALLLWALLVPLTAHAQTQTQAHALALFGKPALPAHFKHFPFVNPNAPKGGELRLGEFGSFDNLNPFTIKGNTAAGIGRIYDTLMVANPDEPASVYGLVAQSVTHPPDYSAVQFTLRKIARFHDGTPITAQDVAWSFRELTKVNPFYKAYYADVAKVEPLGKHKIRFVFTRAGNRELPQILGSLPILPRHYWTQSGRSLADTTLTPPLGSGPYRIVRVSAGRSISFARVPDYWGKDLNVARGLFNFDTIRHDYFGDDTVAFEALKAGRLDYRYEYSSKLWAIGYDTPARRDGRLITRTVSLANGAGMQAFVFNTRRKPFDERAVRAALNWAFDFEWTNKTLFYGQYARSGSFFEKSELAAQGLPSKAERALLDPLRGQIPDEVFTKAFKNPVTDASGSYRKNLRVARRLLADAGWVIEKNQLVKKNATGKATPLKIEFLIVQAAFERIVAPYIQNLRRLGITATIRVVDPTQYQNRLNAYDFDAIVASFPQSLSPGNEQRDFWSSAAAMREGGRNLIGIRDNAVDTLIEKLVFAPNRAAQIAATRALDRVLLWNHYVVPQWHAPHERIAYWQGIAPPPRFAHYGLSFPAAWWRAAPAPYAE